ncbi:MAG: DUF4230 domain-containing protein [Actinomycetota bacterium]|nr:DUF4230 domain-containing protein [Actinomycetota bacterium]
MGKKKDRRGSNLGATLVLALVIVTLSTTLVVGLTRYGERLPLIGPFFGGAGTKTTTSPVVVEGIQKLDQLATVRWTESVVVTKESEGNSLQWLLTGEKVLLVATGEVEAGVDLASLGSEDVEVQGEKVTIRLPEPKILSSSLDEEKTGVYDRDQGLLRLRPDDALVEEARRDAEREITATAQENGILDHARNNAEESIRAFVTTLGFEEIEFVE